MANGQDITSTPSTPPGIADSASSPPPEKSKSKWSGLIPFVPILLALATAFIAHQIFGNGGMDAMNQGKDLTGTLAFDFSLRDAHKEEGDEPVTLSLMVNKGPVVIIFYQGYACPRCIGHLALVANQIEDYQKAGVQIVAISPDTPANTRDSIRSYGDFPFPLLSDRDSKVARAYGLEMPDGGFYHGVFVIDMDRRIRFYKKTDHPYEDIESVLQEAIDAKKPM